MPATVIVIAVIVAASCIWCASTQRRLVVLDENVNHAMSRIGVRISSRFDALSALLELTACYAEQESEALIELLKSERSVITAHSAPEDVLRQENAISEVCERIVLVSEQYPKLRADENYKKTIAAVDTFGHMVCTSRLIYNDSVTKLNRELRMFPVLLIAGILGFHRRKYLER